jgi:hypothetical protein
MNTSVRFNHRLLTTSTFDSGALGVLAYVVHQFPPGRYHAIVQRDGQNAGSTRFRVDDASASLQLTIDLASVATPLRASAAACACQASAAVEVPTLSPKGYVLFHVSGGAGGYSVVAREESGAAPGFDSTTLSEGDLFAVSLLEPATYSMANQAGNAAGEIQVTPVPEGTNPRTLPAQYVDVTSDSFDPATVSVHSAQGLVFRIKGPARVVINKQPGEELRAVAREGKPLRRRVHLRRLR